MRTIAVLVLSSAILAPTFASANHLPQYKNEGQCNSALKQMRNDERRASTTNSGVFNQMFKANDGRSCQAVRDGNGNVIGFNIVGGGAAS